MNLADRGWFQDHKDGEYTPMPIEVVHQAIEEFVRAIEGAYVGESTPTACERLIGALFIRAIETAVTDEANRSCLVTIEEA